MFAPSATIFAPLATSCLASSIQKLVLRGAGQGDVNRVHLHTPAALCIYDALLARGVFGDAAALHFLDLLHQREVDACRVVDPAGGVGEGDHFRAELLRLLGGVDGDIARADTATVLPSKESSWQFKYS